MHTTLHDPVSVYLYSDLLGKKIIPTKLIWKNREYTINKLGMHHKYKVGTNVFHVFSVVGDHLFFRLVLDTTTLSWQLQEVSDGLPS